MSEPPNIIKAITMYRSERMLTYDEALIVAVEAYRKRGWEVPQSIRGLYERKKKA